MRHKVGSRVIRASSLPVVIWMDDSISARSSPAQEYVDRLLAHPSQQLRVVEVGAADVPHGPPLSSAMARPHP